MEINIFQQQKPAFLFSTPKLGPFFFDNLRHVLLHKEIAIISKEKHYVFFYIIFFIGLARFYKNFYCKICYKDLN